MRRIFWIALAALALVASGCATSGGGGGSAAAPDAPAAAPKMDVKNETGDNGLLTPRAIIARYVEALGGEEAIRKHESRTTKGKMELAAMGMSGDVTIYAAAPDKMVMEVEMAGFGTMNNGYNGEVGWSDNPMAGAQLLEGKALKPQKQQADFYAPLHYEDTYSSMETLELTEFEGQSAYKVKLVDADGDESTEYFAEDGGLLLGVTAMQSNQMGESEVTTVFSDYKDFSGLMQPATTVIKMTAMGMEIKNTVTEVTVNDVTPEKLEPPDSIKALIN